MILDFSERTVVTVRAACYGCAGTPAGTGRGTAARMAGEAPSGDALLADFRGGFREAADDRFPAGVVALAGRRAVGAVLPARVHQPHHGAVRPVLSERHLDAGRVGLG